VKTRVTHAMNDGDLGDYAVYYKTWVFGKWRLLKICKSNSGAQRLAKNISEFSFVINEYKNGKKVK
jgi:hypothetical protein